MNNNFAEMQLRRVLDRWENEGGRILPAQYAESDVASRAPMRKGKEETTLAVTEVRPAWLSSPENAAG
jgi:hypothetical protein